MDYLKALLRYTLLLALTLALYVLTPRIGEQTGIHTTLPQAAATTLITLSATFIWLQIILLRGAPPKASLLLTEEGKRELLWRLVDEPSFERPGWPRQFKTVGAWTSYGAGFTTAATPTWYTTRTELPVSFPIIILGAATVVVSVVLIFTRLTFERWAETHPDAVEHVLNAPTARAVLERARVR